MHPQHPHLYVRQPLASKAHVLSPNIMVTFQGRLLQEFCSTGCASVRGSAGWSTQLTVRVSVPCTAPELPAAQIAEQGCHGPATGTCRGCSEKISE
jgi:hypothetical protein